MITHLVNLAYGIAGLIMLGIETRFRFRGPYWEWRYQTAFGRGAPESRREWIHALLLYAVWVGRIRRLR